MGRRWPDLFVPPARAARATFFADEALPMGMQL
jgi:hypothetical protein